MLALDPNNGNGIEKKGEKSNGFWF